MFEEIVTRTMRVPKVPILGNGSGQVAARQFDVVLMKHGFKASRELLEFIGSANRTDATSFCRYTLKVIEKIVGSHVQHNVYFREFPKNVPDTLEFWMEQATHMFVGEDGQITLAIDLNVNQTYGRYQHTYEEMLAAHEQYIPSIKDRVTVLTLGKSLAEETVALYHQLAASPSPLSEDDRELLVKLADLCVVDKQPEKITLRENRAIINKARLERAYPLMIDTVTDVLRLLCIMSDGDVTLETPTKFKSMPRGTRFIIMEALNNLIGWSPEKLADVLRHTEQWKRVGERLHPHEYTSMTDAQKVFAVARGETDVKSFNSRVEQAYASGDLGAALKTLEQSPGALVRHIDRLARTADRRDLDEIVVALDRHADQVSGRVLLSLLEHIKNRVTTEDVRIFANKSSRAWVQKDERPALPWGFTDALTRTIDREISRRLPKDRTLVVERDMLDVALPLSSKMVKNGLGVLPRGSVMPIRTSVARFFVYWKEKEKPTDYDLSSLMLGDDYQSRGHVSYTNRKDKGAVHSGDITHAKRGAFEAIDIELAGVDAKFVVPSVNIYSGEPFTDVDECFFGYMARDSIAKGLPFEPKTVQTKSEMRGAGKVALPFVIMRDKGRWQIKWMHLFLKGSPNFNRVETNKVSTSLLAKSIIERQYVTVSDIVLMTMAHGSLLWAEQGIPKGQPITYIGLSAPEGLHPDSKVITPNNLTDLIPV